MKKIISLSLAFIMIFCFIGCVEEELYYEFRSNDVSVAISHDAKAVAEKLGEAQSVVESDSCGGGAEPDREYTYAGFKFNSVNENGVNRIVKIVLTDDSVSTPEGISIGSTRDEVIAAYGEDFTENAGGALVYTDGKTKLMFGIKDGEVSAIQYTEA